MTQPWPPPPPAKKTRSGCFVAFVVTASIALVVLGIGALLLWRAARSPAGQRATRIVADTAQVMWKSRNAPGTDEVRKKGRCEQAFVIAAEDMQKLGNDFTDGGAMLSHPLVMCQVSLLVDPPSCLDLARAYVDAVHPTTRFDVAVKQTGSSKNFCQLAFTATGSPVH